MKQKKKVYESPELEHLTLTLPEELAALSVDEENGDEPPQTFALKRSGVWTPWV